MCLVSKPKKPKPVAAPPSIGPVEVDEAALQGRARLRRRAAVMFGRRSTISGAPAPVPGAGYTAGGA